MATIECCSDIKSGLLKLDDIDGQRQKGRGLWSSTDNVWFQSQRENSKNQALQNY